VYLGKVETLQYRSTVAIKHWEGLVWSVKADDLSRLWKLSSRILRKPPTKFHYTLCSEKHPLTFSFISPWAMCIF